MIEVKIPVISQERLSAGELWRIEPRVVTAQVFVWRGEREDREVKWSLGEFVLGSYGAEDESVLVVDTESG